MAQNDILMDLRSKHGEKAVQDYLDELKKDKINSSGLQFEELNPMVQNFVKPDFNTPSNELKENPDWNMMSDVSGGKYVNPPASVIEPIDNIQQISEPESNSELKKIMADIRNRMNQPINFGSNDVDFQKQLLEARQQRDNSNFIAGLGNAGTTIAEAFMRDGKKLDRSTWDQIQKTASNPIEDVSNRLKMEEHDPNSAASVAARENLKRLGIKFQGTPSAATLKPILASRESENKRMDELSVKAAVVDENAKTRRMQQSEYNRQKSEKEKTRRDEHLDKRATQLSELVNKDLTAGQRSVLGNAGRRDMLAESLKAITSTYENLNDVPPELLNTVISDLGVMITGGVPSKFTFTKMAPENAQMYLAKLKSLITSKPTPANQAEYIKLFNDLADRELTVGKKYRDEFLNSVGESFDDLKKYRKDQMERILRAKAREHANQTGATQGSQKITIREKATGVMREVTPASAEEILKDSGYERVK